MMLPAWRVKAWRSMGCCEAEAVDFNYRMHCGGLGLSVTA